MKHSLQYTLCACLIVSTVWTSASAAQWGVIQSNSIVALAVTSDDNPPDGSGWTNLAGASGSLQIGSTLINGVWVAPIQDLSKQAKAALASCTVAITSTGTPALSATYPCDPATASKIGDVVTTLTASGAFPGGVSTFPMKDASGAWHSLTPTQYLQIGGVEAAYVAALSLIADGNPTGATALPANSAQIP